MCVCSNITYYVITASHKTWPAESDLDLYSHRCMSFDIHLVLEYELASEMRAMLIEGIVRLLLFRRFQSTPVLTQLIITYFDPRSRTNENLSQCLSVFFPAYAQADHIIKGEKMGCGHMDVWNQDV